MEQCPQGLSLFCEFSAYLPRLSKEEWLSFILGTLVVVFFAIDHYKIPTYAKTTIGNFIELAPESLTSAQRYRKGLYIYISLIFALYLAFCFFWSQGLTAILSTFGLKIDNLQLWPLAAATAVTLIGTAGDKNPLGRLEATLRSIAHESAYIPDAVLNLSSALNGSFDITNEMVQDLETNPDLLAQITRSQDGSLQTWIRAKYLFSRLDLLRKDQEFQQLLNRPENIRAFDFLNEERQTLTDRVSQRLDAKHADLDEVLKRKVENFRNAISVFLASLLWQGCGNETGIHHRVIKLKLSINSADRHFSWNFMARVLASIGAAAVLTYVILYLIDWQLDGYLGNDFWYLTLAVLIFWMTALFVTRRREARFIAGKTDGIFDASLGSAFFCGIPIGFAAAVATFAIYQGGQARFWAIFWTGLSLAILVALLFEVVMRWAAQSPPPLGALRRISDSVRSAQPELRGLIGKALFLYASAAFVSVFLLFWIGQQLIAKGAPTEAANAASSLLTHVIKGYSAASPEAQNRVDERFTSIPAYHFTSLQRKIKEAQSKIDTNTLDAPTIDGIVSECDQINHLMDNKLLHQSCKLNVDFTKTLGDGEWLEHLREAMLKVEGLVNNLRQLLRYKTAMSAIGSDWPRALVVSSLWGFLAAIFSASILLYRRSVLWDTINGKVLTEYIPDLAISPEVWLRTPIYELDNLTPLEAVRYHDLRASLSDYLKVNKPQRAPKLKAVA